jgi:hypothetical protein
MLLYTIFLQITSGSCEKKAARPGMMPHLPDASFFTIQKAAQPKSHAASCDPYLIRAEEET